MVYRLRSPKLVHGSWLENVSLSGVLFFSREVFEIAWRANREARRVRYGWMDSWTSDNVMMSCRSTSRSCRRTEINVNELLRFVNSGHKVCDETISSMKLSHAATLVILALSPPLPAIAQEDKRNWWEFGLADPVLDEIALYYLGQTWQQSSDVAEVLETLSRLNNSDPWSWTTEWKKTAERLETLGKDTETAGTQ